MRTVSIVGSTGSIGRQAIEVVEAEPDRYRVVALGASTSLGVLADQARRLRPERVAVPDPALGPELESMVPVGTEVCTGPEAMAAVAEHGEVVVNAVVGFAGLVVTLAALEAGRQLALANKESLVAGGPVVARARATPGARLVPVDSEHSAVHQCLRAGSVPERSTGYVPERSAGSVPERAGVARIVLTASGGPFRGRAPAELGRVTVDDALAHPTWSMGPKITVDSSTLMNKGLEVIEAHELFGVGYDQLEVVVHPQSIVHSMVEFTDGSTMAQLSNPDMRLPISYALAYPDRAGVAFGKRLDWCSSSRLDFEPPDRVAFPCLDLAYAAGRQGGTAPAWLNGANEVAVEGFLAGRIPWTAISEVIDETLAGHDGTPASSVDVVIEADRRARERARRAVERRAAAV